MVDYPPADQVELGYYVYSAHLLALEVMRRGDEVEWVNRSFFLTTRRGHTIGFWCTRSVTTSSVAAQVASRKDLTQRLLRRAGVAVAEGRGFENTRRERALRYGHELGFPLAVKPVRGSKGAAITTAVRTSQQLERAWDAAAGSRYVLIERHFEGDDAGRFLVVGRACVAASKRTPASVVGDGRRSIRQLIDEQNEARSRLAHRRKRLIAVDEGLTTFIGRSGRTLETVLGEGEPLILSRIANTSRGAETVDITDDAHSSYLDAAVRATAAIPGLSLAGVDVLAHDLTAPATPENHIVVELNSMPGIRSHHFPDRGRPRDAAGAIIDHVYAQVDAGQAAGHASPPGPSAPRSRWHRRRD